MKKILLILFLVIVSFSLGFAQQKKAPVYPKVKQKDILACNTMMQLLSLVDSTKDYSRIEIVSYAIPTNVNGTSVSRVYNGSNLSALFRNAIYNTKPGRKFYIESIQYVKSGTQSPVKMLPDVSFIVQ
ncbi:MAG: hypothetical protein HY840_12145 [Bacteroidetes bacterium]|nr:hypothetical protein [Bacteroidota bacterium]